jgi:hypothetical protein
MLPTPEVGNSTHVSDHSHLHDHHNEHLSASSYDIANDGSDVTVALQAAITNAAANGGYLFLPVGSYGVTTSLTIPSNFTLEGSSKETCTIVALGAIAGPILDVDTNINLAIKNLKLDGDDKAASGIRLTTTYEGFIEGVRVDDCTVAGIHLHLNVFTYAIRDCYITGCARGIWGEEHDGIDDQKNNIQLDNCIIVLNDGAGIWFDRSVAIRVHRCDISGNGQGGTELYNIRFASRCILPEISSCYLEGGGTEAAPGVCISIGNDTDDACDLPRIVGNYLFGQKDVSQSLPGTGNYAIQYANTNTARIEGNFMWGFILGDLNATGALNANPSLEANISGS